MSAPSLAAALAVCSAAAAAAECCAHACGPCRGTQHASLITVCSLVFVERVLVAARRVTFAKSDALRGAPFKKPAQCTTHKLFKLQPYLPGLTAIEPFAKETREHTHNPHIDLERTQQFGGRLALCSATMQVAPSSDGIQKLLAAETEASKIVAEARKGLFGMRAWCVWAIQRPERER